MYSVFPNFIIYSILFILCYNVLAEPRLQERVLGGLKAKNRSKFAYVASININQHHVCGGALIRLDAAVSSATCCTKGLGDEEHVVSVMVGCLDLHNVNNFTEVSEVKEIFIHPEFNHTKHQNDIAVLWTKIQFDENAHVQPINLPTKKHTYDQKCIVAGWGKPTPKFHLYTRDLHYGVVSIAEDAECFNLVKRYSVDTQNLICTIGNSRPAQFDEGSPLVCENTLIGIVIYTEDYGNEKSPGVYVEVFPYLDWIESGSTKLMTCFLIIVFPPIVARLP